MFGLFAACWLAGLETLQIGPHGRIGRRIGMGMVLRAPSLKPGQKIKPASYFGTPVDRQTACKFGQREQVLTQSPLVINFPTDHEWRSA